MVQQSSTPTSFVVSTVPLLVPPAESNKSHGSDHPQKTSTLHDGTSNVADLAISQLDNATILLNRAGHGILGTDTPILSVIIPAFNEIRTIEQVMCSVDSLNVHKQIILVDDGSTDGTREKIQAWSGRQGIEICLHSQNQGKGAAIQSGIRLAKGSVVIVQDADLEYNPQDILKVIQPILDGETDVVYGSRYLGNSHQDQSLVHRFGNSVLTGFSNWMTNQSLTDMETCYKAFRRELLLNIQIEQKRFGFEPEITAKLANRRIVIREVPISYKSRSWKEGKKIGVRDLVSTLWCIIKYRFVG
ncbi:MAG: glycosyltransferase family 2 protein [Pirellula sp.]